MTTRSCGQHTTVCICSTRCHNQNQSLPFSLPVHFAPASSAPSPQYSHRIQSARTDRACGEGMYPSGVEIKTEGSYLVNPRSTDRCLPSRPCSMNICHYYPVWGFTGLRIVANSRNFSRWPIMSLTSASNAATSTSTEIMQMGISPAV